MKKWHGFTWVLVVFAAAALAGAGCSKKAVKSGEEAPPTAAQPPAAPAPPPTVTTEPMPAPPSEPSRTAAAEAAAGVAATEEKPSIFEDIHFDYDKSFIRPDAKAILDRIAAYLKSNAGAKLAIEGHCDERGTPEYNMALGERRAASAKSYLASLGIAGGRLSTVSYGEEKPVDPGHSEAAWAKNRRAHFLLK